MDIKYFEKICRMSQHNLKKHLKKKLKKKYEFVESGDGYVYAQGSFPVLLVAHMDTVHKDLVKTITYKGDTMSSPQGIGGDDRCGVYMILKIMHEYDCSILFCEDEEIGCIGTNKFLKTELAKSLIGKFNYIIEFDRKGNDDAVFYECDNPEFEKFVTQEFYKKSYGSLSDISYLAPHLEAAAVNLSCGYYKAHTTNEYVNLKEMDASIKAAKKMLARTTESDVYEYIDLIVDYDDWYNDGYSSYFDSYQGKYNYDIVYEVVYMSDSGMKNYEVMASSQIEAIGAFCMENPDKCYNDILDVFEC